MPSFFESLSMVALEAWALGRPVLANAKCDVLKGQCIRSNAGLYYDSERGIRRDAARDRVQQVDRRQPREERAPVLPRQLRLAGHRAEVPRHAAAAVDGCDGRAASSRCRDGWSAARRTARRQPRSWRRTPPGPSMAAARCPSRAPSGPIAPPLPRRSRRHRPRASRRQRPGSVTRPGARTGADGRSSGQGPGAAR